MISETFDVAIVGSGPAGLTAAIYTSRANLKTLVLAGSKWGGQLMLTTTVENFPGFPEGVQGPELLEKLKVQAEKFGAKLVFEDVIKIEKQTTDYRLLTTAGQYQARAVIIATGADTVWLNLPNEQRLIGHGVSSCAPCDAFFFRGKKVAVVGGGDSAMEEALFLTKFASEVTIIHRRESFRASKIMQERVLSNPKIKVLWNTEVTDVLGNDHVEGLLLKSTNPSPLIPSPYPVDGLFVAIGHTPNSKTFKDIVDIDEKGYIHPANPINPLYPSMSRTPGIFVAGDVHDHMYKQAITAAGYGCQAALEVERWIGELQ